MSHTVMKRLAFVAILLVGALICAIDFFWKSPGTVAASEMLMLFHAQDAAVIEKELVDRYQASAERAQRIRQWVQAQQPLRALVLKRNGHDGFHFLPDHASHYVLIKGQKSIGHLAVNLVAEQPPRSVLSIVADDLSVEPLTVPGIQPAR
jgi:hypothetical protein